MSEIRAEITVRGTLHVDEDQLRALEALVGYGADPFLKVFYEHLGQSYLRPHERGLRRLFETVRKDVPPVLRRLERARQALEPVPVEFPDDIGETLARLPQAPDA